MAEEGPRLQLIQVPGAGLDRIDRNALRPGMRLASAYGHEVGIAEYIMGAMISLARALRRIDAKLRQGQWESQWAVATPPPPPLPELAGKTLAILGFGHIGQALAQRARAFDMRVMAIRRQAHLKAPAGLAFIGGLEELAEVLRRADYLAITLPLSHETRGLLELMKPTAYLINVARAEIINEAALYRALASGSLAGAALDVWYRYPTTSDTTLPSTQPFQGLANVIMTPHVSGWTEGMLNARATLIAANIERTVRGEPPLNAVDACS
jgi:phosphoglycerate dehydrogenase-like enzyme